MDQRDQFQPRVSQFTLHLSTSNQQGNKLKSYTCSTTTLKHKNRKKRNKINKNKVYFQRNKSFNKQNNIQASRVSNLQNKAQQENLKIYKNIKIITKVATFLNNVKQRSINNLNILGQKQISYLQNEVQNNNNRDSYLIQIENPYLNYYSMLFLVIIIITIWGNTYQMVLGKQQQFIWLKIISLVLYLIWIILKLNSQLKTQELTIIYDRKTLTLDYLKNDFLFQLSAAIALIFQIIQVDVLFYPQRILFMTSILTYQKLMDKISNSLTKSQEIEKIIIILKLIMRVLIFLHFLALFLLSMGQIQERNGVEKTWITDHQLQDRSSFQKYITGYYWAATTMSTVGFGQITPTNVYQRAVLAFVQIFCCLFFGYCVNIIGNTISLIGQSSQKYLKQSRRLNRYLKTLQISNDTKNEIKQYLYNKHKIKQSYDQQNQKQMLSWMNQNLKQKIDKQNNSKIIQNSKYLKKFSQQTKQRLAELMKKKIYAPNQILFHPNTSQMKLFLVDTGIVKQFIKCSQKLKKPIADYNKQDNTIGYLKLITGNKYNSITKADNYVFVYEIDRQQFLQAMKKNQKDYMMMNQVRQKILQKMDKQKLQCYVCKRLTHNVLYCPKVHFIPRILQMLIKQKSRSYQLNTRLYNYTRNQNKQPIYFYKQQQKCVNKSTRFQNQESFKEDFKFVSRKQMKSTSLFQNDFYRLRTLSIQNRREAEEKNQTQDQFNTFKQNENKQFQFKQQFDKVILDQIQGFFTKFQIKNILKNVNKKYDQTIKIQQQEKNQLAEKIKGFFSLSRLRSSKNAKTKKLVSSNSSKLEKNIQINEDINQRVQV